MRRNPSPASARERAAAALLLSGSLLFAMLPAPSPSSDECEYPSEFASVDGLTTVVSCERDANATPLRGPARLLFGQTIDPNQASERTLEALPGIGPGRAAAIVAARVDEPFAKLSDLERVRGIGPRTVSGLEGLLRVESGPRPADR